MDVNKKMDESGSCSKQKHPLQDQEELQLAMEKRTGSLPPSCPQQQYSTVEYDQQETAAKELYMVDVGGKTIVCSWWLGL